MNKNLSVNMGTATIKQYCRFLLKRFAMAQSTLWPC
ncbi:protein of unknown function (plasmid) [Pararobbsia alpina]